MLTGEIRNQVDQIWNAFWSGGVSNPLSVIEQITYLLFIKRLDDLHTLEESKAETLGIPMERRVFPKDSDERGRAYADMRWSRFKNFEPREMMTVVADHVFPFLRTLGEEGSSYGTHMKDARLGFSNAALLAKAVEMLDKIPMEDRDTKGDPYEYMLGKIATAGQNGQFRTPRHLIQMMVELVEPTPDDVICDPAAGTAASWSPPANICASTILASSATRSSASTSTRGFFMATTSTRQLRIGSMNMTLHGVENPDISYRDSLAQEHTDDAGTYSLVLANPPFAGSLDYEATAKDAVLSSIAIIRPDTRQVFPEYLAHFLRTPQSLATAAQRKTGSALTRIILKDIRNLRVPLPSLDEQKRIAAILDQADELRRLRQRTINRLNELEHTIFYEMFGDPIQNTKQHSIVEVGSVTDCIVPGRDMRWTPS